MAELQVLRALLDEMAIPAVGELLALAVKAAQALQDMHLAMLSNPYYLDTEVCDANVELLDRCQGAGLVTPPPAENREF